MPIETIFSAFLIGYAVNRFYLMKRLLIKLQEDVRGNAIQLQAKLALSSFANGVSLIGMLSSGAVFIIVLLAEKMGGTTPENVANAIMRIQQVRDAFVYISPFWGGAIFILLVLAFGLHAYRKGKVKMEETLKRMWELEFKKFSEQSQNGLLEPMEPTPQMGHVGNYINQLELRKKEIIGEYLKSVENISFEDGMKISIGDGDVEVTKQGQDDSSAAWTISIENDQIKDELKRLNEEINALSTIYNSLDIHRRIDVKLNRQDVELPKPVTLSEKVQTFFISQGLLSLMNRSTKALTFLCLFLLIPSLVSFYSYNTAPRLENRVLELQDLQITLHGDLIKKDLENNLAGIGITERELDEEDLQLIDAITEAFENQLIEHDLYADAMVAPVAAEYQLRTNLVRKNIIDASVQNRQATLPPEKQLLSKTNGAFSNLDPKNKKMVDLVEKSTRPEKGPVTTAGKKVKNRLITLSKRSDKSINVRLREGLASFQAPIRHAQVKKAIVRNLMGEEMERGYGGSKSDQESRHINPSLQKQVERFDELKAESFANDLAKGRKVDEALHDVKSRNQKHVFIADNQFSEVKNALRSASSSMAKISTINEVITSEPPRYTTKHEAHIDNTNLHNTVQQFGHINKNVYSQGEIYASTLAKYDDWFPASANSAQNTSKARVLKSWSDSNRFYMSSNQLASNISRNATRARSFVRLRGFSRVGGVLIGREPEDKGSVLEVDDFSWREVNDKEIQIIVKFRDGTVLASIPHKKIIAYHALIYACDERPLTVTMAKAGLMPFLRIHLHPTLEDTPMGYRAIEIDRFVDRFTGSSDSLENILISFARQNAHLRVEALNALYTWAWGLRINSLSSDDFLLDQDTIRQYKQYVIEKERDPEFMELVRIGYKTYTEDIEDTNKSPIVAKPEFYDNSLVAQVVKVLREANSFEDFTRGLRFAFEKDIEEINEPYKLYLQYFSIQYQSKIMYADGSEESQQKIFEKIIKDNMKNNPLQRILAIPPEFEIWSGVREKEYMLIRNEIIMQDRANSDVIQFMLQTAFTSEPINVETDDEWYDQEPWDFPYLKNDINNSVKETIRRTMYKNELAIYNDMQEFTILQRFFRLALGEKFGLGFPIEKLELFLAAVKPKNENYYRTARWNAGGGQTYFVEYLTEIADQLVNAQEKLLMYKDDDTVSDFVRVMNSHIVLHSSMIAALISSEIEFQKQIDLFLENKSEKIQSKQWDSLWLNRADRLIQWSNRWQEVLDDASISDYITYQKEENLLFRKSTDLVQELFSKLNTVISSLRILIQYRVDIDNRQRLEEDAGIIKLPPDLY